MPGAAIASGLLPRLSGSFSRRMAAGALSSVFRSSVATSTWPRPIAWWIAFLPRRSFAASSDSTSARPSRAVGVHARAARSSSRATCAWPRRHAMCSGVWRPPAAVARCSSAGARTRQCARTRGATVPFANVPSSICTQLFAPTRHARCSGSYVALSKLVTAASSRGTVCSAVPSSEGANRAPKRASLATARASKASSSMATNAGAPASHAWCSGCLPSWSATVWLAPCSSSSRARSSFVSGCSIGFIAAVERRSPERSPRSPHASGTAPALPVASSRNSCRMTSRSSASSSSRSIPSRVMSRSSERARSPTPPPMQQYTNGVRPKRSATLASAEPPTASSSSLVCAWPASTAACSAVRPPWSTCEGSAPATSRRSTLSAQPPCAA